MVRVRRIFYLSFFGLAVCKNFAYGYDFSAADSLFVGRDQGQNEALEARKAYESALNTQISEEEKIYTITQMGRLDIVRAIMIPGLNTEEKKNVLEECVANSEKIAASKSQQYFYFKAACLAFRAKLAQAPNEILRYATALRDIKDEILDSSKDEGGNPVGGFEGGGCLRVLAGVYANAKAKILGLFKPKLAEEYADLALLTKYQYNKPFSDPMSGKEYFENYYYKAFAMLGRAIEENEVSLVSEAANYLKNTNATIVQKEEDEDLPLGREVETKYYQGRIIALYDVAEKCKSEVDFHFCLLDEMKRI